MKLTDRQLDTVRRLLRRARERGDLVAIVMLEQRLWRDLRP